MEYEVVLNYFRSIFLSPKYIMFHVFTYIYIYIYMTFEVVLGTINICYKKAFLSDQWKEIEETIEWERLEISSRKLEIPREYFMQDGLNKGQKWHGPNRSRKH